MGNNICCGERDPTRALAFRFEKEMEMDETCSQFSWDKHSVRLPSRDFSEEVDGRLKITEPKQLSEISSELNRLTIRLPRKITNAEEYEQVINGLNANKFLQVLHIDLSNNWLDERQLLVLLETIGELNKLKDLEISIEMNSISDSFGFALADLIRNKRKLKKLSLNFDPEALSVSACKAIQTAIYVRANPIKKIHVSGLF